MKRYLCIKKTTWRGVMVAPNPQKPFIVSVDVGKSGKTILDNNPCWAACPAPPTPEEKPAPAKG